MEHIIRILGMFVILIPLITYLQYIFTHMRKKSPFDYHIEHIKDHLGNKGVFIAYGTKISFGIAIISLGILMMDYFESLMIFPIFFVFLILYIILKYFDRKY